MAAALHVTSVTMPCDLPASTAPAAPSRIARTKRLLEQRVKLGIDAFIYRDFNNNPRLPDLTLPFDRHVERNDPALFGRFDGYRFAMQSGIAHGALSEPEESALLIEASRHLGAFLGQLFHTDQNAVKSRTGRDNQVAR